MKYVKKPIEIEAIQLTLNNIDEVEKFIKDDGTIRYWGMVKDLLCLKAKDEPWQTITCKIETLEGIMEVKENDWIIKGINGEFYPCKPGIFEKTYELIK